MYVTTFHQTYLHHTLLAEKILLTDYSTGNATIVGHHLLVVGKVLVSLETKLGKLMITCLRVEQ